MFASNDYPSRLFLKGEFKILQRFLPEWSLGFREDLDFLIQI